MDSALRNQARGTMLFREKNEHPPADEKSSGAGTSKGGGMYLNDRSLWAARSVVFPLHNAMSVRTWREFIWCMRFPSGRTTVPRSSVVIGRTVYV